MIFDCIRDRTGKVTNKKSLHPGGDKALELIMI
jgi:hypothetical protein